MNGDRKNVFARGEEFLNLFKRGADFTQELLRENERLRTSLTDVQSRQETAAQDDGDWNRLREQLHRRIHGLEEDYSNIRERLQAVEEENQQFAERYLEVEEENNNLANLYVASYQLHSTLDLEEVLKIIVEIVINLVGAEVFAVYLLDQNTKNLHVVAAEGQEVSEFPTCPLGSGAIGKSVSAGETAYLDRPRSDDLTKPIVCIPLEVQKQPIGAIAVFSLLVQKEGFSALDHELFTLLGGHAATSILAGQLYSQSERKLNTIQDFIDLLTK